MNTRKIAASLLLLTLLFGATGVFAASFNSADEADEIIASIGFDPKIHGFGFRNFGENPDYEEDLTADDLIRMFGAENVCIEGSTPKDCVLYETAERWAEEAIEKMNGGHCDGFSVSSLRMFVGRPFKGRKKPSDFQRGAVNLFDLQKNQITSNYVSFYQTLTFLKETYAFRAPTFKKKPSEIVEMIAAAMNGKKEFYTLEVWMKADGKYTRGHSIVPIAIEDFDDDNYRIHVYDNNYPGQTKYVTVNVKNETWRYHTANNPAETARDYVGSAASNTLGGTDSEETADLQIYGAGFVVGFSDISVDKGETLNMTVSPDGRELSFTASADGETPGVYLTTDDGADNPSYEFEIGGITLAAGKTVSVKLDPDKGLIYFKDDDGGEDKYDVKISRTNPNGKVDTFEEFDMDIGDDNSYVLNFGAWDGKSDICVKDDEDEDGAFEDEECTQVEDEEPPAKKSN